MSKVIRCLLCNELFSRTANGQKYCPKCKKTKLKAIKPNTIKSKKECKDITSLAVEARAHGMSYGQYVAMIEANKY